MEVPPVVEEFQSRILGELSYSEGVPMANDSTVAVKIKAQITRF